MSSSNRKIHPSLHHYPLHTVASLCVLRVQSNLRSVASTDGFSKLQICNNCNDSVHSVRANNWTFRAGAGDDVNRNLIPYGSNRLDGCIILHRGRGVGVPLVLRAKPIKEIARWLDKHWITQGKNLQLYEAVPPDMFVCRETEEELWKFLYFWNQ